MLDLSPQPTTQPPHSSPSPPVSLRSPPPSPPPLSSPAQQRHTNHPRRTSTPSSHRHSTDHRRSQQHPTTTHRRSHSDLHRPSPPRRPRTPQRQPQRHHRSPSPASQPITSCLFIVRGVRNTYPSHRLLTYFRLLGLPVPSGSTVRRGAHGLRVLTVPSTREARTLSHQLEHHLQHLPAVRLHPFDPCARREHDAVSAAACLAVGDPSESGHRATRH